MVVHPLRLIRVVLGDISQADLAKRISVSSLQVNQIECGKRRAGRTVLEALEREFGITLTEARDVCDGKISYRDLAVVVERISAGVNGGSERDRANHVGPSRVSAARAS